MKNKPYNLKKTCDNSNIINQLETDAVEYMNKENIPHRCSKRNGKVFILTADFRTDRITYIVEDDKVSSYKWG